ncbi:hypothetical protein [Halosimplex sp. J119]
MAVTADDLRAVAERLRAVLAVYDRFVAERPDESGAVPEEGRQYLADRGSDSSDTDASPGVALAAEIEALYYEAREVEAAYIQQVRKGSRPDWSRVLADTDPVREAALRVHAAGFGIDPETGDPGYLLPRELCPAALVSMNPGSSPVTFDDRVAQYRAVADRFDRSPDVVYYPGSGHDVSPSAAFPDARVVYGDVDAAAMADLDRAGYEAVGADAAGYELDSGADVIVFRNAGLLEEPVVGANLRPGGLVLANDHLESARHVAGMDALELIGVVPNEWAGDVPPVETDRSKGPAHRAVEAGSSLDLYVFRKRN